MSDQSLIAAAIAAIKNGATDAVVNEAFARAVERKPDPHTIPEYPSYCHDLQAVLDEMPNDWDWRRDSEGISVIYPSPNPPLYLPNAMLRSSARCRNRDDVARATMLAILRARGGIHD